MASQESTGDLEQQLRQMILGNVKIQDAPSSNAGQGHGRFPSGQGMPSQDSRFSTGPSENNRGYGRGNRGRGRGHRYDTHQSHYQQQPFPHQGSARSQPYVQTPAAPRRGGPQYHQYQNQVQHQTQSFGRGGSFNRGGFPNSSSRGHYGPQSGFPRVPPAPGAHLWSPDGPRDHSANAVRGNNFDARWKYLDDLAIQEIPTIEMTREELAEKDAFRQQLEAVFVSVVKAGLTESPPNMSLQNFGSLKSGFATKGSDMDLVIVDGSESTEPAHISLAEDGLPRKFEKELLTRGIGARLLTRARVPIIKICESPTPELLSALREAREKWDALPDDEKLEDGKDRKKPEGKELTQQAAAFATPADTSVPTTESKKEDSDELEQKVAQSAAGSQQTVEQTDPQKSDASTIQSNENSRPPRKRDPWTREKKKGPLDFPNDGVGIQCDINFFNPLGIHNTHMLYCYSLCDPRVRPMILFVKAWARKRKINNPYSGTLSSYGYVLMVLHYLINVARPAVVPNLQMWADRLNAPLRNIDGWEVHFWGDEDAITKAAQNGEMTGNGDPLGALLKSFFQYYASTQNGFGFVWMKDVLSLRTPGGVLTKEEKGWTGAKTETTDLKEVRHRYLFAIEDPFELTHNVARTVTHPGIVAIRDEFRRAWRILGAVGNGFTPRDGGLMDDLVEEFPTESTQDEAAGGTAAPTVQAESAPANPPADEDIKHPKLEN
ncbi:hypothetical protein C1H76_2334 [Elsinoe australis]|uniref:polynucleotide adenylyltransferase n=1 Tax=Elsinoe australis TaxID=40998 RepID=A0A4U7BBK6_9PEZI|nr:hypothetical protein C1H76_2334 [Elsinoe australis]